MENETHDAEFVPVKNEAPIIDASECKEIIDVGNEEWLFIKDVANKLGKKDPQTIRKWWVDDGHDVVKASTDAHNNLIVVVSVSWLRERLERKNGNFKWIDDGNYTPLKIKNNQLEVVAKKETDTKVTVTPNETINAELAQFVVQSKSTLEDMKRMLIENSLKVEPESLSQKTPKLFSVGGLIIVAVIVATACVIVYTLTTQHEAVMSYRNVIDGKRSKQHGEELTAAKKEALKNHLRYLDTMHEMKVNHKGQLNKKNDDLQALIDANKKLTTAVNENLSSSKEEVQLEHLSDSEE